jgi:putative transposase
VEGLTDGSRRPYRYANQPPFQVENYIFKVKREHTSWGARKIRERLLRRFTGIPMPAQSTIHAVLDRYGLVERRGRTRRRAQGTGLSAGQRPNDLWGTDYKGEFLLGNRHYCYPLTVTDHASRFLLCCEALSSTPEDLAFTIFESFFRSVDCPPTSAAIMAFPSPPRMLCSTSASSLSGGCASASASNAFVPVIRSRTVVRNACTSP